jgi:transglutaminase-like putative cysteine protease
LASKRGACRDFAVLMMEAARALGFAARFVSGYLYDPALIDCVDPMIGGGTTHAWCAIYLPGAGWVEYDPTNGLVAGRNLIRVCTAREPHQATPLSGGYIGRPEDFLDMTVNVEVMVGDPPGFDFRAKDAVAGPPNGRMPTAVALATRQPDAKVATPAELGTEASLGDLDLTPS